MQEKIKELFEGRLSAYHFFISTIALFFICFFSALFLLPKFLHLYFSSLLSLDQISFLASTSYALMALPFEVRRFHDIGWSGKAVILLYLGLISKFLVPIPILLGLLLLFKTGTNGSNQYGEKLPTNIGFLDAILNNKTSDPAKSNSTVQKIMIIIAYFIFVSLAASVFDITLYKKISNPPTVKKEISNNKKNSANNQPTPKPIVDPNFVCGTFTIKDLDNNVYNTVKIGTQCWMKENIKVTKDPEGNAITRYCYNNDPSNCDTDGGLYDWTTAMNGSEESVQGICPDGWHVPTDSEWYVLESGLATGVCTSTRNESAPWKWECDPAGAKLKHGGSSGFDAVFAGFYSTKENIFNYQGKSTGFWSSTRASDNVWGPIVWNREINIDQSTINRSDGVSFPAISLRCLKD